MSQNRPPEQISEQKRGVNRLDPTAHMLVMLEKVNINFRIWIRMQINSGLRVRCERLPVCTISSVTTHEHMLFYAIKLRLGYSRHANYVLHFVLIDETEATSVLMPEAVE